MLGLARLAAKVLIQNFPISYALMSRPEINFALLGAGGKMGLRVTEQIGNDPAYDVRYVEPATEGQERLRDEGIDVTAPNEALDGADVVALAVSDHLIGEVASEVVPKLHSGAMVILLDPAAAHAGVLPNRSDISYFVAHPCHPSFETADTGLGDSKIDWFGGQGIDEQDIVCSLHQGPEDDYALGETIARDIYAPVRTAHRLSTEHMALLEPSLVETLAATLVQTMLEGMDDVIAKGVPEEAAYEFLMGHLRIHVGIIFGHTDFPYSDAAQNEIKKGKKRILAENWRDVLSLEQTERSTQEIAGAR